MITEILAVNPHKQLAAIRTSKGITVIAWQEGTLHEGEVICGNLLPEVISNQCFKVAQRSPLSLFVVAEDCSDDGAINLLFT